MTEAARTPRPLLISDAFDFLAVGGASLIVPLSLGLYVKLNATWSMTGPLATLLWLALILPHYTSSYQLLYWDRREKIFREPSYFFAAVLVPVAAAGLLAAVYLGRPLLTLAGLLHMLFFLSGWHYAKQAYGATLALSAAKNRALSLPEKSAIRVSLLTLAAVSFVIPNTQGSFPYEGAYYRSLGFPSWFGTLCLCALAATMVKLVLVFRRRARDGPGIPWTAAAAFLSIYAWGFPLIFYPQIFHAFRDVPFVQYFTEGYAFHAAYWHDEFGTPRSHGCVNLSPIDAAWLFNWTLPEVPAAWHAALSLKKGTLVFIHP